MDGGKFVATCEKDGSLDKHRGETPSWSNESVDRSFFGGISILGASSEPEGWDLELLLLLVLVVPSFSAFAAFSARSLALRT